MASVINGIGSIARRDDDASTCDPGNDYDGQMGIRIASIFVILIGSLIGATLPVFLEGMEELKNSKILQGFFFLVKYFGSGVIVATAFIHLLAPAVEALTSECLKGKIPEYPWYAGIILMALFVCFFVELMIVRHNAKGGCASHAQDDHDHNSEHSHSHDAKDGTESSPTIPHRRSNVPGEDHLGHSRGHVDIEDAKNSVTGVDEYSAQITAVLILEFGVIFHSIFIGLSLAVAGAELKVLFIVLVFHQTFEGLGLGSRLAEQRWPKAKRATPYALAIGYALSTPIAIAIGLGVRTSLTPGSATYLIVNGVFDSLSAAILIYTGLIELMAHEFMFSPSMLKAPLSTLLLAYAYMCLGAGLMALLGKWA